jgi:hypothetical protein
MTMIWFVAVAYLTFHCSVNADDKDNDALAMVKEVLQAEADGKLSDRKTVLNAKVQTLDHNAKWHAGQIRISDRWTEVTDIDESSVTESIKRYLAERGDEPLDLDGHRRMANWCAKNKLEVQASAHWQSVLRIDPNDAASRKALNYRLIDGEWRTDAEWLAASEQAKARMKELKKWMPQMKQWAEAMANPKNKTKLKALKELESLDDASAVLALELTAMQLVDDNAIPFIQAIRKFKTPEACESLVRIAMIDPSAKFGGVAMEGIKQYPLEFYVPNLLGKLSDSDVEHQLFTRPNGETVLRQIRREHFGDFENVSVLDNVLLRNHQVAIDTKARTVTSRALQRTLSSSLHVKSRPASSRDVLTKAGTPLDHSNKQYLNDELARVRQKTKDSQEVIQSEVNHALFLLRNCTEQSNLSSIDEWRGWWNHYNERVRIGNAYPVQYSYSENRDYARETVSYIPGRTSISVQFVSCLVASTPIQTDRGLRPIETIRQGDLILSQDIQTGELAMKPVIATTLRPPAKTKLIVTEENSVRATMGHYWWIAGRGWVRTKELEPGMRIHHVTGTTTIERLEDATDEPTYNLVVADNHSYFVGPERLLSYDATDLTPTLQLVPGLPASSLVGPIGTIP